MALSAIPIVYMMDVDVKKNKQSFIKTAKAIVRMVDVDIFLIVQIVVGICNNPFNNLKEKEKNIKKIIQCSIDRLGVA